MIATADTAKGSTISTYPPLLLLPPRPSSSRQRIGRSFEGDRIVRFCPSCGRAVHHSSSTRSRTCSSDGVHSQHQCNGRKVGDPSPLNAAPPTTPLLLPGFPSIDVLAARSASTDGGIVPCRACSDGSCTLGADEGAGTGDSVREDGVQGDDNDDASESLTKYLDRVDQNLGQGGTTAAAVSAAVSLVRAMDGDDGVVRKFVEDSAAEFSNGGHESTESEEVWALLRAAVASSCYSGDESKSGAVAAAAFLERGPDQFTALTHKIRRGCLYSVSVPHPLSVYAEATLLKLSDDELDVALVGLGPYVDWAFRSDGRDDKAAEAGRYEEVNSTSSSTEAKIVRWRHAARLAQTMGTSGAVDDDGDNPGGSNIDGSSPMEGLLRRYHVVCPALSDLPHSCVPNSAVVGGTVTTGTTSPSSSFDSDGDDPVRKSLGAVRAELIALHDIKTGERLTLSRLDGDGGVDMGLSDRTVALRELMGTGYVCNCARCRYERCNSTDATIVIAEEGVTNVKGYDTAPSGDHSFRWRDVKTLGDLAMQHGRYEDAADLYGKALEIRPSDGDILHARAASYLERGSFREAQRLWLEAFELCPEHPGVALQVQKQQAYGYGYCRSSEVGSGISNSQSILPSNIDATTKSRQPLKFVTVVDKKCFVTKPGSPLLTPDECRQAIEWAEDASKSRPGGWATSRHYAVPTTDLPVHEIPRLLSWFNAVLNDRLRPLLSGEFGETEVGSDGTGVYIHDAFVVRYDAVGGQRHLPLHRDQSTHSFTIALNDLGDYDGGGTYVASLGRAIKPGLGGVVSFRGDQLLHGGEPVVRGVRYIIVAFCYVSGLDVEAVPPKQDVGDGDYVRPLSKRSKIKGIFNDGTEQAHRSGGNFSFGFLV